MSQKLAAIAESSKFQNFIIAIILLAGVLVGVQTYPSMVERYGVAMHTLDWIIIGIFVVEIAVKMGAEGSRPWRYFKDPWNVFDFVIVAACFMPIDAQFVTVLRLARLLRVLRLVRALPKLQLLVGALIKSIPSMAYVSVLLGLLFYVYGVAAVFLFGQNDPVHFEDLPLALLSLFRVVTLEDWTDVMYIQMYGCAGYGYGGNEALCTASNAMPVVGALYFVSFVLLGTMIVLNLFIGVIMNGMAEAEKETEQANAKERVARQGDRAPTLNEDLAALNERISELQECIGRIQTTAGAKLYRSQHADGDTGLPTPAASRDI